MTDYQHDEGRDRVFEVFLERQAEEGLALAEASDVLELVPLGAPPFRRYLARFHCKGLVSPQPGEVFEADFFAIDIRFHRDYLRRAEMFRVLTWIGPAEVFHPNIHGRSGHICVGWLTPGTRLVDLLYQVYELITYRNVTMREDDALDAAACAWARNHQDRFPLDPRPLRRPRPEEQPVDAEVAT